MIDSSLKGDLNMKLMICLIITLIVSGCSSNDEVQLKKAPKPSLDVEAPLDEELKVKPIPEEEEEVIPSVNIQLTGDELLELQNSLFNSETGEVIVNEERINVSSSRPFFNNRNNFMLPFYEIMEALDYEIIMDNNTGEIVIEGNIRFVPGVDHFDIDDELDIHLHQESEVIGGVLYMPINFFFEIISHEVFFRDGNIVINTFIPR